MIHVIAVITAKPGKREEILAHFNANVPGVRAEAGCIEYGAAVDGVLDELRENRVVERMWEGDHTVWGPEPEEIANRLGWLQSPESMREALPEIQRLADAVLIHHDGRGTRVLLCHSLPGHPRPVHPHIASSAARAR